MRRYLCQLAAGFRIGIATVHRYIREVIDALAALAPNLTEAMKTIRATAFVILDGTLLPIDRIAGPAWAASAARTRCHRDSVLMPRSLATELTDRPVEATSLTASCLNSS